MTNSREYRNSVNSIVHQIKYHACYCWEKRFRHCMTWIMKLNQPYLHRRVYLTCVRFQRRWLMGSMKERFSSISRKRTWWLGKEMKGSLRLVRLRGEIWCFRCRGLERIGWKILLRIFLVIRQWLGMGIVRNRWRT